MTSSRACQIAGGGVVVADGGLQPSTVMIPRLGTVKPDYNSRSKQRGTLRPRKLEDCVLEEI